MNRRFLFLLLIALSCVLPGGCAGVNAPIREFALKPLAEPANAPGDEFSLLLMPVTPPPGMGASGIVTRTGAVGITTSSTRLWAGSLAEQLTFALAENLRRFNPAATIRRYPGVRFENSHLLLEVQVDRFSGTLGGDFTCSAAWTISDIDARTILVQDRWEGVRTTPAPGYSAYVQTASELLTALGLEINRSLHAVSGRKP